ncbi:uncharacterized protein SPPG_01739 [Spizellomyces punctatus DAOM BR117]|uniref:Uncharacterized protein n=1 Tax=Spizellomyces punctatus (strain DAOM BR117) TaxID=645134 RepID=A0A0L0HNN2_SPIPD|nr:uncharacterized protein SPPG_01739 [Spizellomyces punctatus DAOM BR117]KND02653.1 hypothetical protein SPPG_01739 [Spizellomyces punctatus DAOM BR117]|eukprot:XP_016610692.1 hypothetical protein SPPG_01739 [Spizellomyces punctatus DAOM BR117]
MQAQPQMTTVQPGYAPQPVAGAAPGQTNVVVVTQVVQRPPKDWSHSLFDCFGDFGTMMDAVGTASCTIAPRNADADLVSDQVAVRAFGASTTLLATLAQIS